MEGRAAGAMKPTDVRVQEALEIFRRLQQMGALQIAGEELREAMNAFVRDGTGGHVRVRLPDGGWLDVQLSAALGGGSGVSLVHPETPSGKRRRE